MILATLLAPVALLQSAGEAAIAIKNDNPETWTVEYPRLIQPFVQDYRRCLAVTNRRIAGKADFEEQHSSDVTRCVKARGEAITQSNAVLAGAKTTLSPEQVNTLFDNIGKIHIARGRDLDQQFLSRLAAAEAATETYEASKPRGLVIELRDASVVKARTDATAPAATGTDTNPETDRDSE